MRKAAIIVALVFTAVAVGILALRGSNMAYEIPKYRVTDQLGAVEIREYEPYLVAETTVDGTLETAGNAGFRILARYIFGDNRGARKIPMTSENCVTESPSR